MHLKKIIKICSISRLVKIVLAVLVCLLIISPFILVSQNEEVVISINQAQAFDFSGQLKDRAVDYGLAGGDGVATSKSLPQIIGLIIRSALAFLGVVFLIIIIIAGIRWMWSGGDEETVNKARSSIKNAAIGAVVTLGAYAITYYVLSALGLE